MQWSDEGIILSVRPHGETSAIVDLFSRQHGRTLGLVHGGRSRRRRATLQMGNHVDATWKARLSEHLGYFQIELRRGYAGEAMADRLALSGLMSMCALGRLLAERDPHPALFEVTLFVLSYLGEPEVWPALYVRWEMALLEELGFGLELSACAASGRTDDLVYVSPRSGRAVSAEAGAPYVDKLLALPGFLRRREDAPNAEGNQDRDVQPGDVGNGLALTGYFLRERVLAPRNLDLPEPRLRLATYIAAGQP